MFRVVKLLQTRTVILSQALSLPDNRADVIYEDIDKLEDALYLTPIMETKLERQMTCESKFCILLIINTLSIIGEGEGLHGWAGVMSRYDVP